MKGDTESRLKEFYELYKVCELISNGIQNN